MPLTPSHLSWAGVGGCQGLPCSLLMPAARRFDFWPDPWRRPPPERRNWSAVYKTLINNSESDYRGANDERVEAAAFGGRRHLPTPGTSKEQSCCE